MSAQRFRTRLDRLEAPKAGAAGRSRERDRARRTAPSELAPARPTEAEQALSAERAARVREDRDRYLHLLQQKLTTSLMDVEQIELEELERRLPADSGIGLERAILLFRAEHGQL
jgi:hypothetical protein